MTYPLPSTAEDGQRRKRRVLQHGESVIVDVRLMDGQSASRASATDADRAYDAMVHDLVTAWQRPAGREAEAAEMQDGATPDSAYDAMVVDLANAWKR